MPQNDIATEWMSFDQDRRKRLLAKMSPDQKKNLRSAIEGAQVAPKSAPAKPQFSMSNAPTGVDATLDRAESSMRESFQSGASPEQAEFMGSFPLGLVEAARGAIGQGKATYNFLTGKEGFVKSAGDFRKASKQALSGTLQAATIPSFVVGPEEASVSELVGPTGRAAEKFNQVMKVAKDAHIDTNAPGDIALKIAKNAERGGVKPKVITNFLARVTDPKKGPLTYEEARGFYTNATRLTAPERRKLAGAPDVKRMLGQFANELNESIRSAIKPHGQLENYDQAMKGYHRAKAAGRTVESIKKSLKKNIQPFVAGAVGYEGVKHISNGR